MRVFTVLLFQKKGWINSNIKTLSLGGWASTKQIQTCTNIYSEQTCLLLCEDKNLHTKCSKCLASLFVRLRHKLSYFHDALQNKHWGSSLKKMRFPGQRVHWLHVNGNSVHVKKKTIIIINVRFQIYSDLC